MATMQRIKKAFGDTCAELDIDLNFLNFEEKEDEVIVKDSEGKCINDPHWTALNDLVWNQLGGKYKYFNFESDEGDGFEC